MSYAAVELKTKQAENRTDWDQVDKSCFIIDWTKAKPVLPQRKQVLQLRLEKEIIDFFKSQGKGYLTRMQAVLRAYVMVQKLKDCKNLEDVKRYIGQWTGIAL